MNLVHAFGKQSRGIPRANTIRYGTKEIHSLIVGQMNVWVRMLEGFFRLQVRWPVMAPL
jgi:hypothetical protein